MRTRLQFVLLTEIALVLPVSVSARQLPSRWMDELNWMELREIVPAKVKTVLLTTGTLEPHGVANNGADNLAPVKIAEAIAQEVNALIAPHIPYGVTGSMAPSPGATHIPAEVYTPYVRAVLEGLARNGFKNIFVINGHGGVQTDILNKLTQGARAGRQRAGRELVGDLRRRGAGGFWKRGRPCGRERDGVHPGDQPQADREGVLLGRDGHA